MKALELHGLTKTFPGMERPAVRDVSLQVAEGEILSLVGASGSGKTTLLRMIAGLEVPTSGSITIAGRTVCDDRSFTPPERRGASLVFQDYALFPHLTVARNVAYGLRRLSRGERKARIREVLELVGLEELEDRYPHELSGGQQQRVALARALAPRPAILLLDEPFSNLDRVLKARIREEVGELIRRAGTTAIFVVHDCEDALALGDRIAVLRDGELWQVGTPRELYAAPRDEYVAAFFGEVNLLPVQPEAEGYATPLGRIDTYAHPTGVHAQGCTHATCAWPGCAWLGNGSAACPAAVAYQPEELEIAAIGAGDEDEDGSVLPLSRTSAAGHERTEGVVATVSRVLFRGAGQLVVARTDEGAVLRVQMDAAEPVPVGARVWVRARPGAGRPVRETASALEWVPMGDARRSAADGSSEADSGPDRYPPLPVIRRA